MPVSKIEDRNPLSLGDKANHLLQYAQKKRKSGLFNDINVKVGNKCIPANRMVLSCYSAYFETMFKIEMQERYQDTVEIKGFNEKYVEMLINYMYNEPINVNTENVLHLLAASDYFQLVDVKDCCIEFLRKGLTIENCLDAVFADNFFRPDYTLVDPVYLFVRENFSEVAAQDKFMSCSAQELSFLFKKLGKFDVNQELLFEAVNAWIAYDKENRKNDFPELFHSIDLTKLSNEFLENSVSTAPMVKENHLCVYSVMTTLFQKMKQLKSKDSFSKIVCVGGINKDAVFEIFSIFEDTKRAYPVLPTSLSWHSAAIVDNFIYCIGGLVNNVTDGKSRSVYRLNLTEKEMQWEEVALMTTSRSHHSSAFHDGNIVIVGGFYDKFSTSAEVYEISSNKCRELQCTNIIKTGHELVSCRQCLYAVGGNSSTGQKSLSYTEKLCDLNGRWELVASMKIGRHSFAAVECNGYIYAIGGESRGTVLKSVEKYDPIKNRWSWVSDLSVGRAGHAACVLRGRIFVVGGWNVLRKQIKKMECYNPDNNNWNIVRAATCAATGHALVVV